MTKGVETIELVLLVLEERVELSCPVKGAGF